MHYLSSCSIVKNEAPYIKDFYRIHKYLGVQNFLFYDRSTEGTPLKEIFKDCNDVTVIHFPEPNRHQDAWLAALTELKGKTKWVQFIDIDQVAVPMKTNDLKIMLQDYEQFGSLGLNWHSFGSSGLDVEPSSSTYEAYTKRAKDSEGINNHIQSIVQIDKAEIRRPSDPHHFHIKQGHNQVNENKKPFKGPFNIPPTQSVGFIAHYYTRSRDYWSKKMAKMRADTGTTPGTAQDFDHHQSYMNAVEDLTVKNIWEKAKLL